MGVMSLNMQFLDWQNDFILGTESRKCGGPSLEITIKIAYLVTADTQAHQDQRDEAQRYRSQRTSFSQILSRIIQKHLMSPIVNTAVSEPPS